MTVGKPLILHVGDLDSSVEETLEQSGIVYVGLVQDVLSEMDRSKPDLIILGDPWVPETIKDIRARSNVPVVVLSEKGDVVDRVVGLEIGADDYIVKPFSSRELVARVRAMLRRSAIIREAAERQKTLNFAGLVIDLPTRSVKVSDEEVHLTPKEFDLLYHLASQPRVVLSREDILQQVWGFGPGDRHRGSDLRTVDTHIKRLRKKLQEGREDHSWSLATVWGVGYKFDVAP